MKFQADDLQYGYERERKNHNRIETHLGVKIRKLDPYNVMDWKEITQDGDDTPPWLIEQKSRKVSYDFLVNTYSYNGRPTALIGKNKLDHMKFNGGCGIVYFDFTDKLKYWVYDEEAYKTFDVEQKFKRGKREDCIDKFHPVVHIPCSVLKDVEV